VSTTQAVRRAPDPAPAATRRRSPPPARRRLGRTLFRAVLHELCFPTLFALAGILFLVLAVDLVAYSDLVINRGFGPAEVAWIALYRAVPMLGRAIPFAVLVGALVALGRLGADREIVALEASGISARAVAAPVLAFAALFVAAAAGIALVGAPAANRGLEVAMATLLDGRGGRGTPLRPGVVERLGTWRLVAREVSPRGDELRGVVLWAPPLGGTIFAEHASVTPAFADPESGDGDGDRAGRRLLIENGVVVGDLTGEPSQVRFDRMQQVLEPVQSEGRVLESWTSGASLAELRQALQRGVADPSRARDARQEWQQRLALPLATAVFALLAVPLSIARRRPSRASGAVLGIAATAVYYGLLQLGAGLARSREVPVELAVWVPNLVIGGLALVLLALAPSFRGGLPSGWLPRAAAAPRRRPLRLHRLVLDRYVLRLFVELALLCFAILLAAYLAIDVLDNLKWFTKYGSTPEEVLRFYLARLPLLATRVVPMALLVGAALTLSLLGVTGELIGMRACGVPTLRIVAPVLVACVFVAFAYHPLANDLVPRANARASQIKHSEIKGKSSVQTSVWSLSGDRLLEAARLDPMAGVASQLVLYELGPDGLPQVRIDAAEARHVGDGVWRLVAPKRFEIDAEGLHRVSAEPFVRLGQDATVEVEGEHLSTGELRREIQGLEERGYDATPFRVDLTLKLAAPLACVLLPTLALLFAAGGPPFPTPVQTIVASAIAAGGWLLLSAVGASLGYGGAVPPWLAGFGPVVVLIGSAGLLATRVHGFGRNA
jgi:LPS export ABC transporter permease LptG